MLSSEVYNLIHKDPELYTITLDGNRIYQYRNYYYNDGTKRNFLRLKNCDFVILYKPTGKMETSVDINDKTSTFEKIKTYIDSKEGDKIYIQNGKIQKAPDSIKDKWEQYQNYFNGSYYNVNNEYYSSSEEYEDQIIAKMEKQLEEINKKIQNGEEIDEDTSIITDQTINGFTNNRVSYSVSDFDIYVTYEKEFLLNAYDTYTLNMIKTLSKYEDVLYILVPICAILTTVIIIYLIIAIGYKKGKEGIELNDLDKIPLEVIFIMIFSIVWLITLIITNFYSTRPEYYKLYISGIVTIYFVIYILFAIGITTIIKRIKSKTIIENTVTMRILKLCKKLLIKTKKFINSLEEKIKDTWKITILMTIYLLSITAIILFFGDNGEIEIGLFFDFVITVIVIYSVIKRIHNFKSIEMWLKNIYEGNNKERLEEEEVEPEFKAMVRYINDISNGFENAVEEGIKSERLKTELITNVSHDIKTPLTSIINYVDLIKRENIENDKVKEYIEILEAKSHRLKRLMEDLVEASKASSGNVKLNLEKLNVAELINQTTGEFEDKFKDKNLKIITDMPEEEIFIEADSRYMYRIIENVFSNVSKYALRDSRVYVDLSKNENRVRIEIKNISEQKLNISEDELMQRFVRGDKSRFTEGSGLRTFYIKKSC